MCHLFSLSMHYSQSAHSLSLSQRERRREREDIWPRANSYERQRCNVMSLRILFLCDVDGIVHVRMSESEWMREREREWFGCECKSKGCLKATQNYYHRV